VNGEWEREITIVRTRKKISLSRKCVVGEIFKKSTEKRERMRELSKTAHRERARERERERKREKNNHRLVRAKTFKEREREDKSAHFFYYRRETHPFYNHVRALFIFLLKSERKVLGEEKNFLNPKLHESLFFPRQKSSESG